MEKASRSSREGPILGAVDAETVHSILTRLSSAEVELALALIRLERAPQPAGDTIAQLMRYAAASAQGKDTKMDGDDKRG